MVSAGLYPHRNQPAYVADGVQYMRWETDMCRPLALTGTRVNAKVIETATQVTMAQTFVCQFDGVDCAKYILPLDNKSAVCEFVATVNGAETRAAVKPKKQARDTYDQAIERGDSAQLFEWQRDDAFEMTIGGIRKGDTIAIKIAYVATLDMEDGVARFVLPTRVIPRYTPAGSTPVGQGSLLDGCAVNARVDFEAAVVSASQIVSPTYAVTTTQDAQGWRVVARLTDTDKDFVLLITTVPVPEAALIVEKGAAGEMTACMLTLVPKICEDKGQPVEVVLIIDCSGSMTGSPLQQAKRAMDLAVQSLPADAWLNVVLFGSTFKTLWPEPVPLTQETRDAVLRLQLEDMGGTELFRALKHVVSVPASRPRQILVMTDGAVSDVDAIGRLVAAHAQTTRCFCLGIGKSVSHDLVERIARSGNGTYGYVFNVEMLRGAVVKLLDNALQPSVLGVVNWACSGRQVPREPALFNGRRTVIFGLFEGDPANVTVPAVSGPIVTKVLDAGTALHTLAARALIQDLENQHPLNEMRTEAVRGEIVQLATAYNLVSSETSFVAVQQRSDAEREIAIQKRMAPRVGQILEDQSEVLFDKACSVGHPQCGTLHSQGQRIVRGGEECDRRAFSKNATKLSRRMGEECDYRDFSKTATKLSRRMGILDTIGRGAAQFLGAVARGWNSVFASDEDPDEAAEDAVRDEPEDVVVRAQRVTGAWEPTQALATALGLAVDKLRSSKMSDTEWTTIVVIVWLRTKHGGDIYALIIRKALAWLAAQGVVPSQQDQDAAAALF